MNTRPFKTIGIAATVLLLSAVMGRADMISIVLTAPLLSGSPGSVLSFSGTLSNTTTSTVFLNSAGINLSGAFAPSDEDTTGFFNNAPLFLSSGTSISGIALFAINIEVPFTTGIFPGTFTVLGGVDGNAQDIVGSANFTVQVNATTTAPEPSSGTLVIEICLVLLVAGLTRRSWPQRLTRPALNPEGCSNEGLPNSRRLQRLQVLQGNWRYRIVIFRDNWRSFFSAIWHVRVPILNGRIPGHTSGTWQVDDMLYRLNE